MNLWEERPEDGLVRIEPIDDLNLDRLRERLRKHE